MNVYERNAHRLTSTVRCRTRQRLAGGSVGGPTATAAIFSPRRTLRLTQRSSFYPP